MFKGIVLQIISIIQGYYGLFNKMQSFVSIKEPTVFIKLLKQDFGLN